MNTTAPTHYPQKPRNANAVLVLGDGSVFWGRGIGLEGEVTGEVCFNTSMTGYQEILTDPSYAGQIITFTFPHIGNIGTNAEDIETQKIAARGLVLREDMTQPSSWRNLAPLQKWLELNSLTGICGLDTRALTHRIRDEGAPNGVIAYNKKGEFNLAALHGKAAAWPGLNGMDLVPEVTCTQRFDWQEAAWVLGSGYGSQKAPRFHVVAIDYGAKRNILRCLAEAGCRVTVVPATASYEDIMGLKPDGVFLSNGPGDPAATGVYAIPVIRKLVDSGLPLFGICLGHQLLALALGGKTTKMDRGHRGANHPVKDLQTGRVHITSQNHGFHVMPESLPAQAEATHVSLFDGTNQGLRLKNQPVFSVQYHPEASPGPQDSYYLFAHFVELMQKRASKAA
jgi:carbamoyl-phosphate synthase small subunit